MFGILIGHMLGKLTKLYIIVNTQKINNKLELSTDKINKYLQGVSKKITPLCLTLSAPELLACLCPQGSMLTHIWTKGLITDLKS